VLQHGEAGLSVQLKKSVSRASAFLCAASPAASIQPFLDFLYLLYLVYFLLIFLTCPKVQS
jgi:hypothetical protein